MGAGPRLPTAQVWLGVLMAGALGSGALASCDQVQVVVAEPASIQVSPATVTIEIDESTILQATVRDANGTVLGGQNVLWASSDPTIASVGVSGEVLGIDVGVVTITARSGPATGSAQVVVESPPGFALDRTVINLTAATGATAGPETVLISGTGANPTTGLNTSVIYGQPGSDWLQVALSSTSTPASLQLSASTQGLAPGVYQADIVVRADRVPSQGIRVTLVVSQPPTIGLSEASVSFAAPRGGPDPAPQTVQVTNLGTDSIRGLQASVAYAAGQPTGWLTPVLSGTVAPADLRLTASVGSLPQGTYNATVNVSSPDAVNSPQMLPITFVVGPSLPRIQLSTNAVTLSTSSGGPDPASRQIGIANAGGGTLDQLSAAVSYQGAQSGWLAASLNATTAPTTLTLGASASGLPVGTHDATVVVSSSAAANSPQVITVRFTIGNAPVIAANPGTLTFNAISGGAAPPGQFVAVTNGGSGALDGLAVSGISYGSGSGWLSATLGSATAPTTLTVNADPSALAPGTHNATISLTSSASGVTNSPLAIPVTFVVAAPAPAIALSTNTAAFSAWVGGADPAGQGVTVTNGGGGTLDQLSTSIVYGSGSGWLTASLNQTTAPATLTLAAATGALALGTYTATVNVASANGAVTNSPQAIAVTFTVTPQPAIGVDNTPLSMSGLESPGQPSGEVVVLDITNTSGGPNSDLTGLAATVSAPGATWLTATLDQTTAPAVLTVTANAHTNVLAPGVYNAMVSVSSGVASNTPVDIPVTFTVDNAPSIALTHTLTTFTGSLSGGSTNPTSQAVDISNAGGGTASSITGITLTKSNDPVSGTTCTAVAANTTWLTLTPPPPHTSPATITVTVNAAAIGATGTYCGRVKVFSPVAKNSGGPDFVVRFIIS